MMNAEDNMPTLGENGRSTDKTNLIKDGANHETYDATANKTPDSGEDRPKKKEGPKGKVKFHQMYRYAEKKDIILIVIGSIAALVNGVAWPGMIIIFGDTIQQFVDQGKFEQLLDDIPDYIEYINETYDEIRKHIDEFDDDRCDDMIKYYNGSMDCDLVESDDNLFDEMRDNAVIYFTLGALVMGAAYVQILFFIIAAERMICRMRLAFFKNILRQEVGFFDTNTAGELAIKLTEDINKVHDAIGDKGGTAIQWYSSTFAAMIISFAAGWELSLVMVSAFPMLFGSFAVVATLWTTFTSKERVAYAKSGGVAEEVFSSIRTVVAFGGQEKEIKRYVASLDEATAYGIKKSLIGGIGQGLAWFIMFLVWALGFWFGGKQVRYDDYEVKDMMIVFFCQIIANLSMGLAAPSLQTLSSGMGAAYEVFRFIDREPNIDASSTLGVTPATLTGTIRYKNVHFSYPARQSIKILRGIDLTIKPGSTVALVGSSGCGKSTTMQLLTRFYDPDQGEVTLDGVDVRDINIKWLRQHIGLVSQEPVLFATTIAENIRYGREGVTTEQIVEASKNANAYNFIMKLPHKFDTHVGERGAQLSGGQKQRIAIARALVKDPRVLLLDEATSALDTESEAVVQDALDKAREGRTTMVIAHRLSTVRNANMIVAFDKGVIVERGSHEELMSKKGVYYELVINQHKQLADEEEDSEDGAANHDLIEKRKAALKEAAEDMSPAKEAQELPPDPTDVSAAQPIRKMMKMNAPEWYLILIGCIGSFINGALQPTWGVLFSIVIKTFGEDQDEEQKDTMDDVCIATLGVAFASLFAYFFQEYYFGLSGEELTLRVRELLIRAFLRQEIGWYDDKRHESGILGQKLAVDASIVQGALKTLIGCMLLTVGNLGTGLVISVIACWELTLALVVFVPVLLLSGILTVKFIGGAANENKIAMEEASKNAMASISNIRSVASLTLEDKFVQNFSVALWAPYKENVRSSSKACLGYGISQGVYYITFGVCFLYGADLLEDDDVEYYDVFKVFSCVVLAAMQAGRAVAFAPDANKARRAAGRIFGLRDYVPPIDSYSDGGLQPAEGSFQASVRFNKCEFRYPMRSEVQILNGLDLSVAPGQTLALVGESGCGKSTTIQLMERFYDPEKGGVYIDKYNIKDLNIQWLRRQIGLVGQEPTLFDCSISKNIQYGDNFREVTMDEVIKAAKAANIHTFIQSLPRGYDTNVGARGTQLSGGQKQRIAIARALVRKPKILLLDEATSALDTESEKVVQQALDEARHGRTCITIAHRLSTIKDADKIAVIVHGRVMEVGTHNALINERGLYYKLVNAQSGKK